MTDGNEKIVIFSKTLKCFKTWSIHDDATVISTSHMFRITSFFSIVFAFVYVDTLSKVGVGVQFVNVVPRSHV